MRLTREIFAQKAFDAYRGPELAPGEAAQSDEQIDAFVRERGESAYHPCGTCKMGTDEAAVVDGELRVHGLEGLRVVDASVMPSIVSGNLNAPTIMIAEKAADMIKGVGTAGAELCAGACREGRGHGATLSGAPHACGQPPLSGGMMESLSFSASARSPRLGLGYDGAV